MKRKQNDLCLQHSKSVFLVIICTADEKIKASKQKIDRVTRWESGKGQKNKRCVSEENAMVCLSKQDFEEPADTTEQLVCVCACVFLSNRCTAVKANRSSAGELLLPTKVVGVSIISIQLITSLHLSGDKREKKWMNSNTNCAHYSTFKKQKRTIWG